MSKQHKVCLDVIGIGDPDDARLYAIFAIGKWLNTDKARWCRDKNLEVKYQFVIQEHMYGQAVSFTTRMDGPTYTEWLLKFR